jgi:hypothetical protein
LAAAVVEWAEAAAVIGEYHMEVEMAKLAPE